MIKTQNIVNAHNFDLSSTDVKGRMDMMEEVECYEKDSLSPIVNLKSQRVHFLVFSNNYRAAYQNNAMHQQTVIFLTDIDRKHRQP